MSYSSPTLRFMTCSFACFLRSALIVLVAFTLVIAPLRAPAQAPAPAPGSSPSAASAPAQGSGAADNSNSEDDQTKAFLHSSTVQLAARILHLNLDTTIRIFLGLNFAVIFLLIAVPLGRVMPRMFRKRSQTLSHDLRTAREATEDAKARLSAVEAKLAGLDDEMRSFRAQVEQESVEDEIRIKASLGEESTRIIAAAEQEIGVAVAQAKRGLRNFAADLAIGQAEKQVALTPETDRALIAEFLTGVSGDSAGRGGQS